MARVLEMWSDLHCPYAYLAAFRLRRALAETKSDVQVIHRSLAIEHVDAKVTPKPILDAETAHILLAEPEIPYEPWTGIDSSWPVTMWPAFEAVKCAERQSWQLAHALDWELRRAFWAESRCISMRYEIMRIAKRVEGLDLARFEKAWDAGAAKQSVIDEARRGWETLDMQVSPTFVLPDGSRAANPAGPLVELSDDPHPKVLSVTLSHEDARAVYRRLVAT